MKQKLWKSIFAVILVFTLTVFFGCTSVSNYGNYNNENTNNKAAKNQTTKSKTAQTEKSENDKNSEAVSVTGQLKVHYINVGQGDSILIQQGSQTMLIDTGTSESRSSLIAYLNNQNISKIDVLVLTHPHEDHIGGAEAVIKGFDIGAIYMPKVTANTKTFKSVVSAVSKKGLKAKAPNAGDTFNIGSANCTILGPINRKAKDLNTYSIVIKLVFGNNKFMFTGDAQTCNEEDMLNKGFDLSADVLKVGHHGSHTSTSSAFLNKVNPKYAVISCGQSNDYGHPHKVTMDRLKAKGITVYRTDESGNIVCISDGNNISFNVKAGDYKYGSEK